MKDQALLKKIFIYGIGNISVALANFFFVPFYTYYLSTSEYGSYDLIVSTSTLLLPIVSFNIELALLRWLLPNDSNKSYVFTNVLAILAINVLIFSIIYFLVSRFVIIPYGGWIFTITQILAIYTVMRQFARGLGKNLQYVFSDLVYILTFLVEIIVFLRILHLSIHGLLIASTTAYTVALAFLIYRSKAWTKVERRYFSISLIKDLLKYSLPLIPNTINILLLAMALKYVIALSIGVSFNGLFAVAYKFASLILVINTVFYLAWQEVAIQTYNREESAAYFTKVLNIYIRFLGLILILFISSQFILLPLVVSSQYHPVTFYIPVLLLGNFFMVVANYYGIIYQCERKTKNISYSSLLGTLLTLGLSIVLINKFGIYAIITAFAAGNLAMLLYRVFDTKKFLRLEVHIPTLVIIILFCICMTILPVLAGNFWSMIIGCIIGAFYIGFNYQMIRQFKSLINDYLISIKTKI